MDLILADENFEDVGIVYPSGDFEYGDDTTKNDFELTGEGLEKGYLLYADGEEVGGYIAQAKYEDGEDTVYTGYTWRGLLTRDTLPCKTAGEPRKLAGGEANAFLKSLLSESEPLKAWFEVSTEDSGITLPTFTVSAINITYLQAIDEICSANGCHLKVWAEKSLSDLKVHLKASIVTSETSSSNYAEDSRVSMTFTDSSMGVNHLRCTYSISDTNYSFNLYLQADGSISQTSQYYTGRDACAMDYDVGNVESKSDAIDKGKTYLLSVAPKTEMEIAETSDKHEIGDKVKGSYQKKGLTSTAVVSKIVARCSGRSDIEFEYDLSQEG